MSNKTLEQKIQVMQAASEGRSIKVIPNNHRSNILVCVGNSPILEFNWAEFDYEVYEEPRTLPSINWLHVSPEYKWMATDESGYTYLFKSKPYLDPCGWYCNGYCSCADDFSSFVPGTCDWRDSLVQRPE